MIKSIPAPIQLYLYQYEDIFNSVNKGTSPDKIYPGNSQLIDNYKKITNANEADFFFAKYGVGNATSIVHNPFERQMAYELLLQIIKSLDPVQYYKIHKGTPYYFIGWTTYQYRDIAKAIFYMDAAVSEDMKLPNIKNKSNRSLAIDFFLLNSEAGQTGFSTHLELYEVIEKTLKEYKNNGGGIITIEDFRRKFIIDLLYSESKERSLLTALYTFLLEYQEKQKQIDLRSDTGGSIQPFLDHLFDGARILESLLEKRGGKGISLHPKIVNSPAIAVSSSVLKSKCTLAEAELTFNILIASKSTFQDCNFASAYIIRNTTSHSLLWPDQFLTVNSYTILYNNLVNSIFWSIEKLWM